MVLRVGLLGCGTIGQEIANAFADGTVDGHLHHVFDIDSEKTKQVVDLFDDNPPEVVDTSDALPQDVDLVVEAAGQGAVADVAVSILDQGCDLMMLSVGALADTDLREAVIGTAERTDATLHVPSGAIAGIDAVKAAALTDDLEEVSITTTKNPAGLEGAPYLIENDIDLSTLGDTEVVFEGSASEAAKAFPSNINVALSLSLAGLGPDETKVRIIADPDEENNVHEIEAVGAMGNIHTEVRNVPSPTNPKTSYLAAISAIEKLRGLDATVQVGT